MGMFTDAVRLPSIKFPVVGATMTGTVAKLDLSPVPTFDKSGRPSGVKLDDDGNEVMQVDVTVDSAEGGRLVLHTNGGVFYAIGRESASIGATDLEVGDKLTIDYAGDAKPTAPGRNGAKQYTATVVKATAKK